MEDDSHDDKENDNKENNAPDNGIRNEWDSTQYIFTEEELMTLCLEAKVSFNASTVETDTAAELNILLAMLPLMLAACRSGKCIAVTMNPISIAVSGWKWFGAPFLAVNRRGY